MLCFYKICVILLAIFDVFNDLVKLHVKSQDIYIIEPAFQGCSNFFHSNPWPIPKNVASTGLVKLCQTQKIGNSFDQPLFATLYNTITRIPLYSANTVILFANQTSYPRPTENSWNRVATNLCNITSLPNASITSNLDHANGSVFNTCIKLQAISNDYHDNGMNLDRGHLTPNHINSRHREKQLATFTLTNAAPQFADFNEISWSIYECVTEYTILDLVPGETVYILTGTYGSALDKDGNPLWLNKNHSSEFKNPVKVPGFYWKAVCYPGDKKNKDPWGYAIVQENVNVPVTTNYTNYITLKEFAQNYFNDLPFGTDCLNASFGKFSEVFSVWEDYIKKNCH